MEALTPAIPAGLPDNTRPIRRMFGILQNPMAMYSPTYFRQPVVTARAGTKLFAQIMDPDLAQEILQDQETFGRSEYAERFLRPALGNGLLTAEKDDWRPQRRAASPAFRAQALNSLVPTFTTAGREMAARLARSAGSTIDVAPETTLATFDVIARTLLHGGSRIGYQQDRFADDITLFMSTIGRLSVHELFPFLGKILPRRFFIPGYAKGQAAIGRLRGFAEEIVKTRLEADETDETDLMGLLISAEDPETGNRLSPSELVDNALTFVGAGHETTAVALSWTFYLIGHSASLQDELAAEVAAVAGDEPVTAEHIAQLHLHEAVLKESMRLFPPVPIIPRSVTRDAKLGSMHVKAKDHISIGVYPMHRHELLWEAPDSFMPDRFAEGTDKERHRYQYLPFGGGPRVCIGMRFALMEGIAMMAETMRQVRFSVPQGFVPEPYLAITMRPKGGMPLKVERR
ncbi:cytochrome P450 [Parvularcula marina]|uniref:cytochrome P450 n=1 Tax=Parvularcula marina TaxID=2292771 RepID=UPI00351312AB